MDKRKTLGNKAEAFVAQQLKDQNFIILAQNYSTRYGEIDIIAQKDQTLAFVEVKIRNTNYFSLSEVINITKQKKIIKSALYYISSNKLRQLVFRFDVALLHIHQNTYQLTYIQNAFTKPEV